LGTNEDESDFFEFHGVKSSKNKHRIFWKALYNLLSDDEAQAIDNVMGKAVFRPGQVIFKQGEFNKDLYLFERGQAKHIFNNHGRETFIKKIQPGSLAGEDNFFDGCCCTTTLVAIEPVKVRILSAKRLKQETGYYADLEGRLKDFCSRETNINTILSQNSQDRRQQMRVPLKGLILIRDDEGMKVLNSTSLRGEARDISCGGMAIDVQLAGSYQAQELLGNNFKVRFNLPPDMTSIERICLVLGAKHQDDSIASSQTTKRYLLNMKFTEPVKESIINEYARYVKILNNAQL
jgi:CRP-like cAMP-binding protein